MIFYKYYTFFIIWYISIFSNKVKKTRGGCVLTSDEKLLSTTVFIVNNWYVKPRRGRSGSTRTSDPLARFTHVRQPKALSSFL